VKHILVLLSIILALIPVVKAEDKSWYEIDGIRFRLGQLTFGTNFLWDESGGPRGNRIIHTDSSYSHFKTQTLFPVIPTLPETLMTSWSYRGGVLEFQSKTEVKDLVPIDADKSGRGTGQERYLRQKDEFRTSLYNDFFNASDKAFADANSKWALSADVTSSRVFFGHLWGVFIPIGDYHRFMQIGFGFGAFYSEFSYKLNLCSEYKLSITEARGGGKSGKCMGKTETDSASTKGFGVSSVRQLTFWERVTKDSIWKIMSMEEAENMPGSADALKLKNHDKNLNVFIWSSAWEIISYTYRF